LHHCADATRQVRECEARRLEIRQVALVSRHELWAERREAAARKVAAAQEGAGGVRGAVARAQAGRREEHQEEEREQARQKARAEKAARDAELVQMHLEAKEENEYHERQRTIDMMWAYREAAVRQDEACREAQRAAARDEILRAEAAAREAAVKAAHAEWSREREAVLRADVLDDVWARRAQSFEQEARWEQVWGAEEAERVSREARRRVLEDAHRSAVSEREQAQREAALEADWAYRAQSLEQEELWVEVKRVVEEEAAAEARERESAEGRRRELEELFLSERQRRESEAREEAMEGDWVRKAVAARQEDAWREKRQVGEEGAGDGRGVEANEEEATGSDGKEERGEGEEADDASRRRVREMMIQSERCVFSTWVPIKS